GPQQSRCDGNAWSTEDGIASRLRVLSCLCLSPSQQAFRAARSRASSQQLRWLPSDRDAAGTRSRKDVFAELPAPWFCRPPTSRSALLVGTSRSERAVGC